MKKRDQKGAFWLMVILLLLAIIFFFLVYKRPLVVGPLIVPENITIYSPTQPYYDTSFIFVNISVTDTVLQLNISLNDNVSELCQSCNVSAITLNLEDGQYNLSVIALDAFGTASKSQSFIIDTQSPLIQFSSLTSFNGSSLNNSLYVGIILNESNVGNVTYSLLKLNETSGEFVSMNLSVFSLPVLSQNYTIAMNGTYFFNVSVVDKVNKMNFTETRNVFMTYFCAPQWTRSSICNASDSNFTFYTDANACDTNQSLPGDNGSIAPCDSCIPQWADQYTSCVSNLRTKYQTDSRNCYAQTGLTSDLSGMQANETEECGAPEQQANTPSLNITRNTTQQRSNATKIYLNESQIASGFIATLASNDVIELNFSGKHILKAVSILSNSLILILDANSLPLFVDDAKDFDLDGDENPDMSVKVNSISGGRVSLLLRAIPRQNLTTVVQNNTVNETFEYAEDEGLSPKTVYLLAGGVIAFTILVIGSVWFVIWYNARKEKLHASVGKKVKSAAHSS